LVFVHDQFLVCPKLKSAKEFAKIGSAPKGSLIPYSNLTTTIVELDLGGGDESAQSDVYEALVAFDSLDISDDSGKASLIVNKTNSNRGSSTFWKGERREFIQEISFVNSLNSSLVLGFDIYDHSEGIQKPTDKELKDVMYMYSDDEIIYFEQFGDCKERFRRYCKEILYADILGDCVDQLMAGFLELNGGRDVRMKLRPKLIGENRELWSLVELDEIASAEYMQISIDSFVIQQDWGFQNWGR